MAAKKQKTLPTADELQVVLAAPIDETTNLVLGPPGYQVDARAGQLPPAGHGPCAQRRNLPDGGASAQENRAEIGARFSGPFRLGHVGSIKAHAAEISGRAVSCRTCLRTRT